jgi:hypothetical protein
MTTTVRITILDRLRRGAAVLLAVSMFALAADVYAQRGARPISTDIGSTAH